MGWLVYNHVPPIIRDEIARLCGGDDGICRTCPVLISQRGSIWYAAVRSETTEGRQENGLCPYGDYQTDAAGTYTFAAIFLTTTSKGEWGYKSMCETAGPADHAAHAPEKLLALLSETVNEHAIEWRARCRAHAAKLARPLQHGDVIRLAEPLRFTDGAELQTFRVCKEAWRQRTRTVFVSTKTGGRYRISRIRSLNWTRI